MVCSFSQRVAPTSTFPVILDLWACGSQLTLVAAVSASALAALATVRKYQRGDRLRSPHQVGSEY